MYFIKSLGFDGPTDRRRDKQTDDKNIKPAPLLKSGPMPRIMSHMLRPSPVANPSEI